MYKFLTWSVNLFSYIVIKDKQKTQNKMKNIILTILSVIVLVSCGNQKAVNEQDTDENFNSSYSYISEGSDEEEVAYYYYYDDEEDVEYDVEEIDLTANVTYYTSDGNFIYISRDSYGNISGHDMNGNFYGGYSDEYGNTTMHDYNGNYTYSHTDEFGYTTGHDMNGNYYSAYTDDLGNTTITSY